MALSDYISDTDLQLITDGNYPGGNDNTSSGTYYNFLKSVVSTNGIEALPYQFSEIVDRRITGTEVGRKYGEKIFGRLPLLFLTPCEPLFVGDAALISGLVDGLDINGLEDGRYYTTQFAYADYYEYVDTMLTCLAFYLGINGTLVGGKRLGDYHWKDELNSAFKTFYSAGENVIFYLDGMTQVSESFSNETTESQLLSTINGFSETARELRFLFGSEGSVAGALLDAGTEVTNEITNSLSGLAQGLGGGIVGSLAKQGVNTILEGGRIIFPKIWSNSTFDRSYSIDIKLRSPDMDTLSIFLNILKPYCKILAMTMPRIGGDLEPGKRNIEVASMDPNSYRSPFLVKGYSKGLFNVDMGIISSLSVTKGAECCWNDDGLPTQIDISITLEDLYSALAISAVGTDVRNVLHVAKNTAYMDFLANMAGLNIAQMEVGRRSEMIKYLSGFYFNSLASRVFSRGEQAISRLIGKLYNIL